MPFSNQEYLYQSLPSRYRREDKDLFLKRYLQFFGETLDEYDAAFDAFFENINSETANGVWIEFWLENLFGWSWFPRWFTLEDKRRLYANFAGHLARRGTRRGIELFLLDFGIVARVHTRPAIWGEFVWGETHFAVTEPLHIVVEILFIQSPPTDLHVWDEGAWGEFYYTEPKPLFTEKEITDLIRFVQPHSQEITVIYSNTRLNLETVPMWEQLDEPPHWQQIDW
jgi:phage tail-like protein